MHYSNNKKKVFMHVYFVEFILNYNIFPLHIVCTWKYNIFHFSFYQTFCISSHIIYDSHYNASNVIQNLNAFLLRIYCGSTSILNCIFASTFFRFLFVKYDLRRFEIIFRKQIHCCRFRKKHFESVGVGDYVQSYYS